MKTCAVLTGDLIGSRKLEAARLEQAMALVRQLAREFEAIHPGALVGQPDIFRGDGWQLCLGRPDLAVTSAVFFRAGLKAHGFDTRIGIGLGTVGTLHEEKISRSTGPAFVSSGAALDNLEKGRTLGLRHAAEPAPAWAEWLRELIVPLLELQVARWTQRESLAVYAPAFSNRLRARKAYAHFPPALIRNA